MSAFLFGVRRGKLTPAEERLRERVAKRHGVCHVYARIPGTGLQSWFAARNWGDVRNDALARAVQLELEQLEQLGEVKS